MRRAATIGAVAFAIALLAAAFWLPSGDNAEAQTFSCADITPAQRDCAILVALYDATDGDDWTTNTNWKTNRPLWEWFGVTANFHGHVRRIHLSPGEGNTPTGRQEGNNLTGTLPDLSGLTSLEWMFLSNNNLSGSLNANHFPTSLKRLYINHTDITGPLPDFSGMTNMTHLYLSSNNLSGSLNVKHFPTSLTRLGLFDNNFSGTVPDFSGMTELEILSLGKNNLSGSLNANHFPTSLLQLLLHENDFTGPLPNFSSFIVTNLVLYGNRLVPRPLVVDTGSSAHIFGSG